MRIWVTGASGLVGGALASRLAERGDEVVALVRPGSSSEHLHGAIEVVRGTLPDVSAFTGRPDLVVHCAAHVRGALANDRAACRAVNVEATLRLAERATELGARFVHCSSVSVLSALHSETPLREDAPCVPHDVYGWTKLEGEALLCAAFPDAIVLRPPGIYGPRSRGDIITDLATKISAGRFFHIGDATARRSWVFVDNLVDAILHLATGDATGTFFVDDGRAYSRHELAETVARALGRRGWFPRIPESLARVGASALEAMMSDPPLSSAAIDFRTRPFVLDTSKLRSTGFAPRIGLQEAVERTLRSPREGAR